MMLRLDAVSIEIAVTSVDLADWIARGWVEPGGEAPDWAFSARDVARARLVRDLRLDAGIETHNVMLVLSLLDQMQSLRDTLAGLLDALAAQPPEVRRAVLDRLHPQP